MSLPAFSPRQMRRRLLSVVLMLCVVAGSRPLRGQTSRDGDAGSADSVATRAGDAPSGVSPRVTAGAGFQREWWSSSTPIRVLLGATNDQWRGAPAAWPRTVGGFGQRSGVRLLEVSAQLGALYGTAALLGQDPTYRPLHRGSVVRRTGHALLGSVTAYRADGRRVLAPGTFAGALAAAAVAKQSLPASTMRGEIMSRGSSMLTNRALRALWMEFLSPATAPAPSR